MLKTVFEFRLKVYFSLNPHGVNMTDHGLCRWKSYQCYLTWVALSSHSTELSYSQQGQWMIMHTARHYKIRNQIFITVCACIHAVQSFEQRFISWLGHGSIINARHQSIIQRQRAWRQRGLVFTDWYGYKYDQSCTRLLYRKFRLCRQTKVRM